MRSMMTYLEASRFKALNVMMDLESRPRVSHSLSSYIDYSKDKQGLTAASLKIPSWVRPEPLPPTPQIDLPPIPGDDVNNCTIVIFRRIKDIFNPTLHIYS